MFFFQILNLYDSVAQYFSDLDTPYLLVAGILRMEHYGVSLSAILVVTIERAFATYYVVDYETKHRCWVAAFCALVSLTYTQCFVIPICFCKFYSLTVFVPTCLPASLEKLGKKHKKICRTHNFPKGVFWDFLFSKKQQNNLILKTKKG